MVEFRSATGDGNSLASRRYGRGRHTMLPLVQTLPAEDHPSSAAKLSPIDASSRSPGPLEDMSGAAPKQSPVCGASRSPSLGEGATAWRSPRGTSMRPLPQAGELQVSKLTHDFLPEGNWLNVPPVVQDCFRKIFQELRDLSVTETRLDKKINLNHTSLRANEEKHSEELWKAIGEIFASLDTEGSTNCQKDGLPRADGHCFEERVAQPPAMVRRGVRSSTMHHSANATQSAPLARFQASVRKSVTCAAHLHTQHHDVLAATDHSGSDRVTSSSSSRAPLDALQQLAVELGAAPPPVTYPTPPRGPRKPVRSPRSIDSFASGNAALTRSPRSIDAPGPVAELPVTHERQSSDSARPTGESVQVLGDSAAPGDGTAPVDGTSRDQIKAVSCLEMQMQEVQEQLTFLRKHSTAASKRMSSLWARVNDELSDERLSDLIKHSALDAVQHLTDEALPNSFGGAWAPHCRVETLELVPDIDLSPGRRQRSSSPRPLPGTDVTSPRSSLGPRPRLGTKS